LSFYPLALTIKLYKSLYPAKILTGISLFLLFKIECILLRKELKKLNEKRVVFTAVVERFGKKNSWLGRQEDTILFKDVRFAANQKTATDHIWFTVGQTFSALDLKIGDKIQFEARIGEYEKGYVNHGWIDLRQKDYKLNWPTKFQKI
jgi:hypothetical protein